MSVSTFSSAAPTDSNGSAGGEPDLRKLMRINERVPHSGSLLDVLLLGSVGSCHHTGVHRKRCLSQLQSTARDERRLFELGAVCHRRRDRRDAHAANAEFTVNLATPINGNLGNRPSFLGSEEIARTMY